MKNLTITLELRTLAWARREAAQREISVSRFVGELLEARMLAAREYDDAMRRYLARRAAPLKRSGERYPDREELHERSRIR